MTSQQRIQLQLISCYNLRLLVENRSQGEEHKDNQLDIASNVINCMFQEVNSFKADIQVLPLCNSFPTFRRNVLP